MTGASDEHNFFHTSGKSWLAPPEFAMIRAERIAMPPRNKWGQPHGILTWGNVSGSLT